jgi:NAD+-dependent protein deacetylase SIR2
MTVTLELDAPADLRMKNELRNLSLTVAKSKKIVVVTGAGISCSSGIPVSLCYYPILFAKILNSRLKDFRSSDGLYNLVKQKYPDVVLKGRDLFDASLFRDATSTAVFFTFIAQLKQAIDKATPTPTHHFIKTLDSKKKLVRSYTQNIDGLEERIGITCTSNAEKKGKGKLNTKDIRNVQLHGDIHRVRCTVCSAQYPSTSEYQLSFLQGQPPDCPECVQRCE